MLRQGTGKWSPLPRLDPGSPLWPKLNPRFQHNGTMGKAASPFESRGLAEVPDGVVKGGWRQVRSMDPHASVARACVMREG